MRLLSELKTRRIWPCRGCDKQFTIEVGTIFEDSPLGMDNKWMAAFWMLTNCKNGVRSCEVARSLWYYSEICVFHAPAHSAGLAR